MVSKIGFIQHPPADVYKRQLMNSELDMIREFLRKRRERRGFGRKKTAAEPDACEEEKRDER